MSILNVRACMHKKYLLQRIAGVQQFFCCLIATIYFDPIRSHVIDPMQNLLLGTVKHTLEEWKKRFD